MVWVVVVNIHGKLSDLRINTIVDASSVWPEVLFCIAVAMEPARKRGAGGSEEAVTQQGHDDDIVSIVEENLRRLLEDEGFAEDEVNGVVVGKMGSRVYLYRVNESQTDLDLYTLGCTEAMVHRGTELLYYLGCQLMLVGVAAKKKKIQPEVAEGKKTLVWTTVMEQSAGTAAEAGSSSRPKLQSRPKLEYRETDTSLLFADEETVCGARNATRCAAALLDGKPEWQEVIGELLAELRAAKVLNQHGRGSSVGQHLKTVSFTLWCCGLLEGALPKPSDSLWKYAGNVILAAGCIWQRREADSYQSSILTGLEEAERQMSQHYRVACKPIAAVLVSEGDMSVCKRGDMSKSIKSKTHYVDYVDLSEILEPFTECTRVANFMTHGEVLALGEEFADAYGLVENQSHPVLADNLPAIHFDLIPTDLDIALHTSQQVGIPREVPSRKRGRYLFADGVIANTAGRIEPRCEFDRRATQSCSCRSIHRGAWQDWLGEVDSCATYIARRNP